MSARSGPQVFKFGGSSLGAVDRIRSVAALIAAEPTTPIVIVSAMEGLTDQLEALALGTRDRAEGVAALRARVESAVRELAGAEERPPRGQARVRGTPRTPGEREGSGGREEPRGADEPEPVLQVRSWLSRLEGRLLDAGSRPLSPAEKDEVCAFGEDLSTLLLVLALRSLGKQASRVDARTVVRTDAHFGAARPAEAAIRSLAAAHLAPLAAAGEVAVMQGFVGATADGRTTTLGRGGSDLTAILIGAAVEAEAVHIWTDVEGILSGDPRCVPAPRVLDTIGFEEAVELAYFGAKVLHSGAAKLAVARGVPVRIRSTFAPERPGTLILPERWGGPEIAAVAFKPRVVLVKVRSLPSALPYGFLARVFEILTRHQLAVDLVATSHTSTAFTLDEAETIEEVALELEEVAEVEVVRRLATVTVVGHGLLREPGFDGVVFRAVGDTPVHLISQASDVSLSFVVAEEDGPKMVARLHRVLLEETR